MLCRFSTIIFWCFTIRHSLILFKDSTVFVLPGNCIGICCPDCIQCCIFGQRHLLFVCISSSLVICLGIPVIECMPFICKCIGIQFSFFISHNDLISHSTCCVICVCIKGDSYILFFSRYIVLFPLIGLFIITEEITSRRAGSCCVFISSACILRAIMQFCGSNIDIRLCRIAGKLLCCCLSTRCSVQLILTCCLGRCDICSALRCIDRAINGECTVYVNLRINQCRSCRTGRCSIRLSAVILTTADKPFADPF